MLKVSSKFLLLLLLLFAACLFNTRLQANEPLHYGWNFHGAIGWHPFYFDDNDDDDLNPPTGLVGGGINAGVGYRGLGRWERRLGLDTSFGQVGKMRHSRIKSPDTSVELTLEPLFHFRKNPPKWDPYLIVTGVGLMHLFRNFTSGIIFEFPGLGLQYHLSKRLSGYVETKVSPS